MSDNLVDTYFSTIENVPDQFNIQEMCNECSHKYEFGCDFFPDQFKTQQMFDRIFPGVPIKVKYRHDETYKIK